MALRLSSARTIRMPVNSPRAPAAGGRRFPGAQGTHFFVDDTVESEAPMRQDAERLMASSADVMAASPAFMSQAPRP